MLVSRSDNVKLYEKIKFLQSYQGHRGAGGDDTESRYDRMEAWPLIPVDTRQTMKNILTHSKRSITKNDKGNLQVLLLQTKLLSAWY